MRRQLTHQLIVCVDIESFSRPQRSDAHRSVARQGMYGALRAAFEAGGVAWADCYLEDRGDGALILVPPHIPKDVITSRLPSALVAALAEHNHLHAQGAKIRLRVAVHAGEVRLDEQGVVGEAVNFTFRLLDAAAVKSALSASTGTVAIVVSERIFLDCGERAVSPDGRTLASASFDKSIRLWSVTDPAHAKPYGQPLTGTSLPIYRLAFTPDGRTLVSGGDDGQVRLWTLSPGQDAQWICSTTRNVLTPQQWHAHIPQLPYDPPCR